MIDMDQARLAAYSIAEATLGVPPGRMDKLASRSHHVFASSAVVVKIVDAADHARLEREIALTVDLPAGLSTTVLASGRHHMEVGDVRYACVARLPGAAPGMGLAGVDRATACRWTQQAVAKLQRLHGWVPKEPAEATLREHLDHGGFTGRAQLLDEIDRVRDANDEAIVPRPILDGLVQLAERAPRRTEPIVPVHADCHWGNWLVHDGSVTTLLDFEWARFGEPADDWMFLSRFSGSHMQMVLSVIADATTTPLTTLRAACEVREAAYLTSDLRLALQAPSGHAARAADNIISDLQQLVIARSWWRPDS